MADERPVGGAQTIPQYPGEISDPITGSPKWPSSYGGSFPADDADEFTEGDSVDITLPTDALYDGGGLSYGWYAEPWLAGTNLVWSKSTNRIFSRAGGVKLRTPGRPLRITGTWQAITTDDVSPNRDTLRFRIDINPRDRATFPISPITVQVHRNRVLNRYSLGTMSGGRTPYRYQVVPHSSARHSSPRSLSSMGISHNTSTNEIFTAPGNVIIAPVGTYAFQCRAWDAAALEPLGRTVYIRVDPSAVIPTVTHPILGRDLRLDATVGGEFDAFIPTATEGGQPPYRYSFAWRTPLNNGTLRLDYANVGQNVNARIRLHGTPARAESIAGVLRVDDANGRFDTMNVLLVVGTARTLADAVFTFRPRQVVNERLPALVGARGAVTYRATGTALLERMGLRIDAVQRTISGVAADRLPEGGRDASAWWEATDASDGKTFGSAIVVGIPRSRVAASDQNDLSLDEGAKPTHRIVPFDGGTGDITYTAAGLPPGLRIRASGGVSSIVGTAPQVTADRTWSVVITGTDEVGEFATATLLITVRNVEEPEPPVAGRFSMADASFEVSDAANTALTLPDALLDGRVDHRTTYPAATLDSGITAPEVSISGTTLTLRLASRDRAVDDPAESVWTRTARLDGQPETTAKVTVQAYGRLFFRSPEAVHRFPGDEVDATVPLDLRGGKSPRTITIDRDFPSGAGVRLGVTQTAATIRGTAGRVGTYTARAIARDALGATTRVAVQLIVRDRAAGGFASDEYRLVVTVGEDVSWRVPEPVTVDGGVLTLATVPSPLPADLSQPTINDAQQWLIAGTVTAPPGVYTHTLVATERGGTEHRARLIVEVRPTGDPEIPEGGGPGGYGGCGPVEINRVPRSRERTLVLGSVLPLPGDTGPIQLFRPSSFIVGQQESITFDWQVETVYRGVPILEVDLWRTDPDMPFCAGVPNVLLVLPGEESTASVPHEVASGYRTRMPLEPLTRERPSQEYLYRLVALRAGSSERYLAADFWDLWVRVTILANDIQVSASKTFVPDGYPVMLQWGYRGQQPSGTQVIEVGPRRRPVGELTSASLGPVIDWEPEPGQTDPNRDPRLPGTDETGVIDA